MKITMELINCVKFHMGACFLSVANLSVFIPDGFVKFLLLAIVDK